MRPSSDTSAGVRDAGSIRDMDDRLTTVEHDGTGPTGGGQPPLTAAEAEEIAGRAGRVEQAVASVILGKEEVIRSCVIALLAGGHLILEDYPGVGKTLLAKALARSVGGRFSRIQFTPDLLPSDVTGVNVFDQHKTRFEFRPGPVFANVVLADEINRASPKTQASLLECMEERQATVDNVVHRIAPPFMIIATQNPVEYEGTYPLPEAQLDRFMMRVGLGYPSAEAEAAILDSQTSGDPYGSLEPVMQAGDVLAIQQAVLRSRVTPELRRYVVGLVSATRDHREIYLGASPRAGIALLRAAKARAVLSGRDYVVPQDVKELAPEVLGHRIILSADTDGSARGAEAVIRRILQAVPAPGPGR
jgi:MoxR-like ATPase